MTQRNTLPKTPLRTPLRTPLKTLLALAATAALLVHAGSALSAGKVEVNYVKPEQFTDAGFSTGDRDRALATLSDFIQKLGAALPDGQVLRLDVLDVDLAGNVWPNTRAGGQDIRILRGGADWPNIKLHYTLTGDGTTLKSGDARLADMNYLMSNTGAVWRQGELAYEKHMVQQWFNQTFAAPP